MQQMNLSAVDLNLLVVLRSLLATRSVTRAADAVGLSQPATSHALARLRSLFDDPLLVRSGRLLVPTPRAEALRAPLEAALAAVEGTLAKPPRFDPATAKRMFSIGTSDYGQLVILPPLLERLAKDAPGIDLRVRDQSSGPISEWLASGEIDVVLSPKTQGLGHMGLHMQRLFSERFVSLVRKGHPRVKSKLTLAAFAELPHAFVAPRGTPGGVVDDALRARGLSRRVALVLPGFLVAPQIVSQSDLIVTIGERVARPFLRRFPLRMFPPPLALPGFDFNVFWHERMHNDPGHAWFREQIASIAQAVRSS